MSRDMHRRIGAEIKARRLALNLNLTELAKRADIHPYYLSKVEKGRVDVGLPILGRLADALGCHVAELFGPVEPLSENAKAFAKLFDALPPFFQASLLGILRALQGAWRKS